MFQFKGSQAAGILSYLGESQPFCFIQVFNWLDEAHHLRELICFIQSIDFNVNLIQKHPHRNTQNNVWPNIWVLHDPGKMTPKKKKIYHYNIFIIFSSHLGTVIPIILKIYGFRYLGHTSHKVFSRSYILTLAFKSRIFSH